MTTTGSPHQFGPKPTNPQPRPDAVRYTAVERPWRREAATAEVLPAGGGHTADVPVHGEAAPTAMTDGATTSDHDTFTHTAAAPAAATPVTAPQDVPAGSIVERPEYRRPRAEASAPMVRTRSPKPRSGWQSMAYTLTGGRWNPGISDREQRERDRERQISTQLRGKHVTAFFCLKGGISKTSTTAATSIALSDLRPDPVFSIDANPDAGDLAERLVGGRLSGIAALARDIDRIGSLDDLSRHTATRGRLTVLPGEPNPTLGDSLSADDFDAVMRVVQRYYSFVQVDCGTGVTHPLMEGVLRFADTVVIPAAWSVTGARRAAETIDWLADHGFEDLARTCIVVLTAKDIVSSAVDKDAVLDFLSRAADVVVVPADPHVADGALLDWEALQPATREAYLDIAAAITKRFDDSPM
ncbi:MinD/ParA family ATP-binding protein [Mobilicoccus caccae]|uniref:MinD-like ATPase involved in chromosome partitioning or flagellar assembly n=1 Tax=Mobilicoccus caccae TaxID=1859295 RepID=A0ABQ6IVY9_9MICO|nr:MinD/ParA family protein [Mobilicoccus caccae]GMA42114.1 hypothetical protein GCM10025883_41590 [Mobilicoccus caccae]